MKNPSHEPGTFTAGCTGLILLPTLLLSAPLFLFGAFHVAICIWCAAGSIILTLWLMNAMFGEHGRESVLSRRQRNVVYHREIHASETVYYRPQRPDFSSLRPQPAPVAPTNFEDPINWAHLSERPIGTYREIREIMLRQTPRK